MKQIVKLVTSEEDRFVFIVPTNGGEELIANALHRHVGVDKKRIENTVYKIAGQEVKAFRVEIPQGFKSLTVQTIISKNSVEITTFSTQERRETIVLPFKEPKIETHEPKGKKELKKVNSNEDGTPSQNVNVPNKPNENQVKKGS